MQPTVKIVAAVAAAVLVVVIGLMILTGVFGKDTGEPAVTETTQPVATDALQQETPVPAQGADEALAAENEAQGTMYEGALAGLSEEEIAKLAIAEEQSHARQDDSGAEDAVD